ENMCQFLREFISSLQISTAQSSAAPYLQRGPKTSQLKKLSPDQAAECRKYLKYRKFAPLLIPGKDQNRGYRKSRWLSQPGARRIEVGKTTVKGEPEVKLGGMSLKANLEVDPSRRKTEPEPGLAIVLVDLEVTRQSVLPWHAVVIA